MSYRDTPYVVGQNNGTVIRTAAGQHVADVCNHVTAKRIVNACNSHFELVEALRVMLSDYRSEGCSDPACIVCQASHQALAAARLALAKVDRQVCQQPRFGTIRVEKQS